MKTSFNILKGLIVVLLFALAIPMISDFLITGNLPELLSGTSLAILPMLPVLGNEQLTSLQIKERRHEIHLHLTEMNQKAKKEKRDFNDSETREYEQLNEEFNQLGGKLFEVEKREAEEMASAMRHIKGQGIVIGDTSMPETWIDTRTGQPINVISRDQNYSDFIPREKRSSFSLGKAVKGIITGNWNGAENEQRALSTAIGSGAVLVPTELIPGIIDNVRNNAVCFKSGAKLVPMKSETMSIAKVTGDPVFEIKTQNTSFSEGVMTFDAIDLKAYTLGTIVYLSRELASDASNIVSAIETALIRAISVEIDKYALLGAGTTQPLGLNNIVGSKVIDLESGASLGYDHLIDIWGELAGVNAEPSAYIVNPRDMTAMMKERTSNGYLMVPDKLKNKILHTPAIPKTLGTPQTESVAFAGDFTKMLIGLREGITVEASATAGDTFAKHQIGIKVTCRFDVQFERTDHFGKIVNISAPTVG